MLIGKEIKVTFTGNEQFLTLFNIFHIHLEDISETVRIGSVCRLADNRLKVELVKILSGEVIEMLIHLNWSIVQYQPQQYRTLHYDKLADWLR